MDRSKVIEVLGTAAFMFGCVMVSVELLLYAFLILGWDGPVRVFAAVIDRIPVVLFIGTVAISPIALALGTIAGGPVALPWFDERTPTKATRSVLLAGCALWIADGALIGVSLPTGFYSLIYGFGAGSVTPWGMLFGLVVILIGVLLYLPTPGRITVLTEPIVSSLWTVYGGFASVSNRRYGSSTRIFLLAFGTLVSGLCILALVDIHTQTFTGSPGGGFVIFAYLLYSALLFGISAVAFGIFSRGNEQTRWSVGLRRPQRALVISGAILGIGSGGLLVVLLLTGMIFLIALARPIVSLGSIAYPAMVAGIGWYFLDRSMSRVSDRLATAVN